MSGNKNMKASFIVTMPSVSTGHMGVHESVNQHFEVPYSGELHYAQALPGSSRPYSAAERDAQLLPVCSETISNVHIQLSPIPVSIIPALSSIVIYARNTTRYMGP